MKDKSHEELKFEFEKLRAQLEEAEETLRAIRSGEVDALVVSGEKGEQVFTLKGAELPYRILIEEMSEGAVMLTPDDAILYCNSGLARILKTRLEKLIGTGIAHYIAPADEALFWELLRQGRERGSRGEITLRAGDGTFVSTHLSFNNLQIDDARFVYLVATDLTESKKAEEKIREQAALLDKAHDAIGLRNLEHNLIYWNKGAEYLYGWTAEEAIGKNANELLYKGRTSTLIEAQKSVIEKGEWKGELRQATKNGKEIIVESRWTLIYDSEGKPKSILIINTDITEKKKIELQLLRAQRMESIGTLAGGIAHDINNMLTPIMLSLQMLKEKIKDEKSQKLLSILEKNSQREANLIKQVLLFARGVESEHNPLQVKHLISEIEKIVKETFPRNIEIRLDIQKDLFTISGDATQLQQVLMNMCVNARDAMPEGGILGISAENLLIDENYALKHIEANVGSWVVIVVSDTGIGIHPEILDRIFEPFFTTKQFGKGTGLGLSTALAIVKSHGGFINVSSEVGEGTTFRVYLPSNKAELQSVKEEQLELSIGQGEWVLVADDESSIREVTVSALEFYGYNVLTANDGADAIALYAQNKDKIKVVLMDMMMPVMDGYSSIRAIRKITPGVKIIAVSGLAEKDKLAKIADTHVHAFLLKPYTAERLLRTIHEVLNGKYDETSGKV